MDLLTWCVFLASLLVAIYKWVTRHNNHFRKRNVPYLKPMPLFGNMWPSFTEQMSFPEFMKHLYDHFKPYPYGGIFRFTKPVVLLVDPELIKTVMIKDFDCFTDHLIVVEEEADPMWGRGLFNLRGQRWRDMRALLSPAFTSSKMKSMFVLVDECGRQLVQYLDHALRHQLMEQHQDIKIERVGHRLEVELGDIFTRYTNDVIATTAFGVSVESLNHPRNQFFLMGNAVADFRGLNALRWWGNMFSPWLMKMLKIPLIRTHVTNFFRELLTSAMDSREKNNIIRPDLVHLLMQAKKGTLKDDNSKTSDFKNCLSDDDLTAQAMLFFLAGFSTNSTLMCLVSHQLTAHPHIQHKLQHEIDQALQDSGGRVTYEAVNGMKYLDMVVNETLRLYPPGSIIDRVCVKPYTLPTNPPLRLEPGDGLWISVFGLHRDPEHFPNPESFDPERFSDENKHNIKPCTFLPFGCGPRLCIGNRFALLETKIALVHLLKKFNFKVTTRTTIPLKISKKGFSLSVDNGYWIGLEHRT